MESDPLNLREKSHAALVEMVYRLLEDEKAWRQRWKEEQQKRIALEASCDTR